MVSSNEVLVSVVMCTYNGGAFVAEQLESICSQTYQHLEIIIADDASTDDTVTILEKYAKRDTRISIVKNKTNLGFHNNFTQVFRLAKGDYIAPSDQDDIWHLQKLERLITCCLPEKLLVYCDSKRFTKIEKKEELVPNPRYRRFEGYDGRKLSVFNTISGHAMLIKKDLLTLLLPVPSHVFYDWWAGMLAAYNNGVQYLEETLVYQRIHGNNISVGGKFTPDDKRFKSEFNILVGQHLDAFLTIESMPVTHKRFFERLATLWQDSKEKKFAVSLFLFLLHHRQIIFNHKKRSGFFSLLKHCYRLASN